MIFINGPFWELTCDQCSHTWHTTTPSPAPAELRCPNEDSHSANSSSVADLYRDMPQTTPLRTLVDPGHRFPRSPG